MDKHWKWAIGVAIAVVATVCLGCLLWLRKRKSLEGKVSDDAYALTNANQDLYLNERTALVKRHNELGDIFDKGRVALAGGAIALSATVVKDLAPDASDDAKKLLVMAWLVLTLTLICSLVCVYMAALSHKRQTEILDDDRHLGNGDPRRLKHGRKNGYTVWLHYVLNPLSLVLLGAGIIVLGAALGEAVMNSNGAPKMSEEKKITSKNPDSRLPKSPEVKVVRPNPDRTKTMAAIDRPVTPKTDGDGSKKQ